MPLTSFLHRNPKSNVLPLPPLDPPPSVEKRQEKEKAWLASIYDRKGKALSKADNKDARGLGYTAPAPSGAGQRNHARSRTADSVLTSTSSVGKSSASVKSGLLTISSRWRQSSSPRPAPIPSFRSLPEQQPTAVVSSSSASPPSLAQRLEQLSKAHSQGLLDDEEYRVLRGNLFENSLKKVPLSQDVTSASSHEIGQKEVTNAVREYGVERTGTLLGLPRLLPSHNAMLGSANLSPTNNLAVPSDTTNHSLPLPSSADSIRSTRTRSKLSVRSSKSAFSLRSRVTSLLPTSSKQQYALEEVIQPLNMNADVQDQAHHHHREAQTTLKRKPSFLDAAKSAMTFKTEQQQNTRAALPTEWTDSNGNRAAYPSVAGPVSPSVTSRRNSHLSVSGISSSSASSSSFQNMFHPIEAFTSASALAAGSSSHLLLVKTHSASAEYLKNSSPGRSMSEDCANHSFSTLSPLHPIQPSLNKQRSSTLLSSSSGTGHHLPSSPTSSNTHDAHLKFSVMQAEDELLDAEGLRKAIWKVELEKKNVSEQFAQLRRDLSANLGRSGHDASLLSSPTRAASPRRQAGSGKRSMGSSSSSSIQGGESTFRQSLNIPSGLPVSLSRRPSLANSVQSHQSSSFSSFLSPSSSSRLRPSHLPCEVEDEEVVLSLPMSPAVSRKNGRHRLEGSSDGTESMEGDDKLARLEEKRRNVEMRHDARLEYLHAKLVARELKEKLRR